MTADNAYDANGANSINDLLIPKITIGIGANGADIGVVGARLHIPYCMKLRKHLNKVNFPKNTLILCTLILSNLNFRYHYFMPS